MNEHVPASVFWATFLQLAKAKELSPAEAVVAAGLKPHVLFRWSHGATPRDASLAKLAAYFHVTKQFLLEGPEDKSIFICPPASSSEIFLKNFCQLAKARGLSPTAAASAAGVSVYTVTSWYRGSLPQKATCDKLAAFFGVAPQYLLEGHKDDEVPKVQPDPTPTSFWVTFEKLAKARGLSPSEAAIAAGLDRTTSAGWRRGMLPRRRSLRKLSDYFGVTPEYLLAVEEGHSLPERQLTSTPMKSDVSTLRNGIFVVTKDVSGELCVVTARSVCDILADMREDRAVLPEDGARVFFASQDGVPVNPNEYYDFASLLPLFK